MRETDLDAIGTVEVSTQSACTAQEGMVAFEFPGFDGGLVEGEGPEGAAEEEKQGEEGEGVCCC